MSKYLLQQETVLDGGQLCVRRQRSPLIELSIQMGAHSLYLSWCHITQVPFCLLYVELVQPLCTEQFAMARGAILWGIFNRSHAAYEMWKRLCSLWVFTTILTTLILINSIMTSRCLCLQLFFSGLPVIIKDRYIYEKIS